MKKKNRYPVPACFNSAADYLEFLVMEGAMEVKRYGTLLPFCVIQGIRREMAFIRENDLADFFLYLYNIAGYLQSEDILIGPGRGDSSASLVCFCLGLTTVDPVRNELDPVGFLQLPVTVNVDIVIAAGSYAESIGLADMVREAIEGKAFVMSESLKVRGSQLTAADEEFFEDSNVYTQTLNFNFYL